VSVGAISRGSLLINLATSTRTSNTLSLSSPTLDHMSECLHPRNPLGSDLSSIPTDPKGGYSIEMFEESLSVFAFPGGDYWLARARGEMPDVTHWQPGQALV
jgi:hypothetical protein